MKMKLPLLGLALFIVSAIVGLNHFVVTPLSQTLHMQPLFIAGLSVFPLVLISQKLKQA